MLLVRKTDVSQDHIMKLEIQKFKQRSLRPALQNEGNPFCILIRNAKPSPLVLSVAETTNPHFERETIFGFRLSSGLPEKGLLWSAGFSTHTMPDPVQAESRKDLLKQHWQRAAKTILVLTALGLAQCQPWTSARPELI